jgi:phospholipase/carboxylesterase
LIFSAYFVREPTLPYLERAPRGPLAEKPPLIVLLHGRGAEAKTIFSIQGLLDPRFHVIAITAPYSSSIGGFEWFHPNPRAGDEEIDDAEKILTNDIKLHIDRLNAEKSPLFIWGFSQGAAMSLIMGLRGAIDVKGIVPMSGFLPSPIRKWNRWNSDIHVILSHGSNDEILLPETSRHTQAFLESIGVPSEYYEYKGPHKMSLNAIAHINSWIEQLAGLEAE